MTSLHDQLYAAYVQENLRFGWLPGQLSKYDTDRVALPRSMRGKQRIKCQESTWRRRGRWLQIGDRWHMILRDHAPQIGFYSHWNYKPDQSMVTEGEVRTREELRCCQNRQDQNQTRKRSDKTHPGSSMIRKRRECPR